MIPVIFGLAGLTLTDEERRFFSSVQPAGFILFGRNIADPEQVRALTEDLRAINGQPCLPILVDQEGGRVVRLRPPHWPAFPPAERFDRLYHQAPASAIAAARSNGLALALTLVDVGININCAPMLDVRQTSGHDIVGDRSFGSDAMQVAALGGAMLDGMAAGGAVGVVKHVPGHGRACCDSHHDLPTVDASPDQLLQDMAPFAALAGKACIAMTAHIVYRAWDKDSPATLSPTIINSVIRQQIGFSGLLLSDDIEMNALTGPVADRAKAAIAAGCDIVLHCSGDMAAMQAIAAALSPISQGTLDRLERARSGSLGPADPARLEQALAHRDALLALAA